MRGDDVQEATLEGLMSPSSSVKEIAEAQDALKAGDTKKAQKILRPISLGAEENRHEAVLRLAQLYYAEGNLRDAQSLCEKATEHTVSRYLAQTYCLLGNIYEQLKQYEVAVDCFNRALQLTGQAAK